MVAYYFLTLMFVAIPTWFIWWILKDSRPVYFLAHQVLQKVFRYSPDYEKEKLEGKKLKTLEALEKQKLDKSILDNKKASK